MVENLIEASEHLIGFLIVLMTLSVLWGLTSLIGKVFANVGTAPKAATAAPAPAPAAAEELDEDLVVVATAAAQLLGEPHRVISIRPQASSWGKQGRQDIHASHKVR